MTSKICKIFPPFSLYLCKTSFVKPYLIFIKKSSWAPAGVIQLVGVPSCNQKFAGLILGQDTYIGCGFDPWSRCEWEATNRCFSHVDVSLSPFLSPSL